MKDFVIRVTNREDSESIQKFLFGNDFSWIASGKNVILERNVHFRGKFLLTEMRIDLAWKSITNHLLHSDFKADEKEMFKNTITYNYPEHKEVIVNILNQLYEYYKKSYTKLLKLQHKQQRNLAENYVDSTFVPNIDYSIGEKCSVSKMIKI